MENISVIGIALLIFLIFGFIFYKLFRATVKKEYGSKMYAHWPTQLSLWQTVILYSTVLTTIVLFGLKWMNILNV